MDELNAIQEYQKRVVQIQRRKLEEVQQLQESDLVEVEPNHTEDCFTMTMKVNDIDEEVQEILNLSILEQATVSPIRELDNDDEINMEIKANLRYGIQDVTSSNYHEARRNQDDRTR